MGVDLNEIVDRLQEVEAAIQAYDKRIDALVEKNDREILELQKWKATCDIR